MPLKPKRVSPTIPTGRKTAGSQRQSRRINKVSPTAEILSIPENDRRVTRSRSRDEASRGKAPKFYAQETFKKTRGSNKSSVYHVSPQGPRRSPRHHQPPNNLPRRLSRSPIAQVLSPGPLERVNALIWAQYGGAAYQPPAAKLPGRIEKGVQPRVEQEADLGDSNSSDGESPTEADEPEAGVSQTLKANKKHQKASRGEKATDDIKNQPSTSDPGRVLRKNPGRINPVAKSSTRAGRTRGDPHVDGEVIENAHADNSKAETQLQRVKLPKKTSGKTVPKEIQPRVENVLHQDVNLINSNSSIGRNWKKSPEKEGKEKVKPKIRIQLKEKVSSSDRDSASSDDFPSFDCGADAEVQESLREGNRRGTEATGADEGNETAGNLQKDSATISCSEDPQPSISDIKQKTPVNDATLSSSEDDEKVDVVEPVKEIHKSQEIPRGLAPENTMIQGVENLSIGPSGPMASIFDPDVNLRATDVSMAHPGSPTAPSTHHHDNEQVHENPEEIVDVPGPSMSSKTPMKKKVHFRSRTDHLNSMGGPTSGENTGAGLMQGRMGNQKETRNDSGAGLSSVTTGDQNTQSVKENERRRNPGDHVEVLKSSIPSKSSDKDKAKQKRDTFKSRPNRIISTDSSEEENREENAKNVEEAAGTSSTSALNVTDPSQENNGSTFDISQSMNITLRNSRSSRLSRASNNTEVLPTVPTSLPPHLPGVEEIGAGEKSVNQPQEPSLIQSRDPSAPIPQHLSTDVHERRNISVNTKNSPPPARPTIILPHNSPAWTITKQQLSKTCIYINSLKKIILRCHQDKEADLKFRALENFFSSIGPIQSDNFLHETLQTIKDLALQIPQLILQNISVRQQNMTRSTDITQRGAACLLAHGFFSTFQHEEGKQYGGKFFNFSELYESFEEPEDNVNEGKNKIIKEKLEFIFSYLSTIAKEHPDGPMQIKRVYSPSSPSWWTLEDKLRPVKIVGSVRHEEIGIEVIDTRGLIGGDLFGFTADEEEINSLVHPELIIARLFMEPLGDDEAIFFSGVRRYSNFEGSGLALKFAGTCKDSRSRDFAYIRRKNIDDGEDFERNYLISELNKMNVVFTEVQKAHGERKMVTVRASQRPDDHRDQIVKFLIVAMAAAVTNVPVRFCTCGDEVLNEAIVDLQQLIIERKMSIQSIFAGLCEYGIKKRALGLYYFFRKEMSKSE